MTDVIKILKKVKAIITDSHFVLTSGRHTHAYINKDALYPHVKETSLVGKLFAEKYKKRNIDVVVGPALGGIILSQWVAYHLTKLKNKEILSIYTEKTPEKNQIFTRGYNKLVKGKNVLIVEDLTTTGGSVKKVAHSVRAAGGKVIAVCVMVNRDPKLVNSRSVGAPFDALDVFKIESYTPMNCPLCETGVPINTQVGHGKKYLEGKRASI